MRRPMIRLRPAHHPLMTTVEVGAVRWTVAAVVVAPKWLETSSREAALTTSSREPSLQAVTAKKGELELIPV